MSECLRTSMILETECRIENTTLCWLFLLLLLLVVHVICNWRCNEFLWKWKTCGSYRHMYERPVVGGLAGSLAGWLAPILVTNIPQYTPSVNTRWIACSYYWTINQSSILLMCTVQNSQHKRHVQCTLFIMYVYGLMPNKRA